MVIGSGVVDGTVILGTLLVSIALLDNIGCIGTVVGVGIGSDTVVVVAIGSDTDDATTLDGADCGGFGEGLGEWGVGEWFSRACS